MLRTFVFATLLGLAGATHATAECYDVFGCAARARFRLDDLMSGPNCDFLYTMRNQIYADHHYCFRSARGQATFGNAGCVSANPEALGLNAVERYNAAVILRAERAKGCPE